MATQFCDKCKQSHPGRVCDYNDEGECAETVNVDEIKKSSADLAPHPKPQSKSE